MAEPARRLMTIKEFFAWTRGPEGWTEEVLRGLESTAELTAVGLSLPMSEVYEDVAFPMRPEDSGTVTG